MHILAGLTHFISIRAKVSETFAICIIQIAQRGSDRNWILIYFWFILVFQPVECGSVN